MPATESLTMGGRAEERSPQPPDSLESRIRQRAYEKLCARGCAPGNAESDWLDAERELQELPSSDVKRDSRTEVRIMTVETASGTGSVATSRPSRKRIAVREGPKST